MLCIAGTYCLTRFIIHMLTCYLNGIPVAAAAIRERDYSFSTSGGAASIREWQLIKSGVCMIERIQYDIVS